ncbi:MAG: 5-deoxy-glucuronate isomerase [Chloroflexota bacterium]
MSQDPAPTLLRRPSAPDPRDGAVHRITPATAGWAHVSFAVHRLAPGQGFERAPDGQEVGVVIAEGSATVAAGSASWSSLGSREGIFDGPPAPAVLVTPGEAVTVRAESAATVLVASAPVRNPAVPTRYLDPATRRVEHRGSGNTARRVHHLLPPDEPAAQLILVEVYTPGGNWSSYPPHKHDTEAPPTEALLEELYWYRFARPSQAFAFARVYTPDRSLDQALAPTDGDVVLVPRGYHPVGMPAGYDGYYLNVMAGPDRVWAFTVDPDHAWLMDWTPTTGR